MATQDYVVLRVRGFGSPEIPGGLEGVASSDADLSVMRSPKKRELEEMKKEPDVLGVAPIMPVSLVAPFEVQEGTAAAETGNATWGLQVVGAVDSPFTGAGVTVA
ncbi:MAG: hypothetical protein ACRD3V_20580, partial [Vicinamibacteria bacterium]